MPRRWRAILTTAPRWPACSPARGCDALVNLASLGFGHAPGIVGAAVRAGLDRAVFVSTTAVTTTLPARSKAVRLAAEDEIRGSGLSWTILRPTMIYGAAGDRNLSRLLALLARLRRAPLPTACRCLPVPGGGRQLQQPVHVADLAGAVLTAVERPAGSGPPLRRGRPRAADVRRAAARVGGRGRRPGASGAGAAGAGDRAHPGLRADQPPAQDPGRAVAAAGRGQGVPDRGRRPRPGLRAPPVRRRASAPKPRPSASARSPRSGHVQAPGAARAVIATLTRRSHA